MGFLATSNLHYRITSHIFFHRRGYDVGNSAHREPKWKMGVRALEKVSVLRLADKSPTVPLIRIETFSSGIIYNICDTIEYSLEAYLGIKMHNTTIYQLSLLFYSFYVCLVLMFDVCSNFEQTSREWRQSSPRLCAVVRHCQ